MADGSIIIDTRIATSGVDKGTVDIKKQLTKMADAAKTTAIEINKSLNNIDADHAADGMSASFRSENERIKDILSDTERNAKSKATSIAAVYREAGMDQSEAMKKAWAQIERASSSGSKKVGNDVEDIGSKSKKVGNDMQENFASAFSGIAKKFASILGSLFVGNEILEFGQACLELGSDLQEVQNVVDVVFETMNDDVNAFAKAAAKNAGLSETMAKKFAGTFGAMADAFGFAEEEAYEMATALTQLSGDVASFYNITQDEAYTKLKSVFTGETESLKDLGVVMTQTALDAYAMEQGLGKTTAQMTEQEKVALRYKFVLDQLSNASGDFLRTSDSWANQTRLLSLQFDSLKASIGQGLINVLTPALQIINNDVLPGIQEMADKFAAFTAEIFGDATTGEGATGALDGITDTLSDIREKFITLTEPLKSTDFQPLLESVGNISEKFSGLAAVLGEGLEWAWTNVLVPFGQWTIEAGLPAILDTLSSAFDWLGQVLGGWGPIFAAVWNDFLQPLATWTGDAVVAALEAVSTAFDNMAKNIDHSSEATAQRIVDNFTNTGTQTDAAFIMPTQEAFESTAELISGWFTDSSDNIIRNFEDANTATESGFTIPTRESLQATAEFISQAFTNAKNWVVEKWQALGGWFNSNVAQPVSSAASSAGDAISSAFQNARDAMIMVWESISGWFDQNVVTPVESAFDDLSSSITGIWDSVYSATTKAWENIKTTISNAISKIQSWINGLTGKSVSANVSVSRSTSTAPRSIAAVASTYSLRPQVPYLATGAVIPPNAPFLAMLGDQRHGTNIEAPLSTIQEAVALVMEDYAAANLAGHEATVAILREILEAILGISIGDDVIAQAVDRYTKKMNIIKGGAT